MSKAMGLKARLKNMARENHVSAQAVLQNFMLECLLRRISLSIYKEMFVLKGGMLIASLVGIANRTTMDMDATLKGYPLSEESIRTAFSDICAIELNDGVHLEFSYIVPIRDDDEYGGYRVAVNAKFESISTPLKVDVTTGDVITPSAMKYTFPSQFGDTKIKIWAYPIETILAEKIETILRRSVLNTRPRDFYDVTILMTTQNRSISQTILSEALHATCSKRGSLDALRNKEEILIAIRTDPIMQQRWARYRAENHYANGIEFDEVIAILSEIKA